MSPFSLQGLAHAYREIYWFFFLSDTANFLTLCVNSTIGLHSIFFESWEKRWLYDTCEQGTKVFIKYFVCRQRYSLETVVEDCCCGNCDAAIDIWLSDLDVSCPSPWPWPGCDCINGRPPDIFFSGVMVRAASCSLTLRLRWLARCRTPVNAATLITWWLSCALEWRVRITCKYP